MRSKAHWSFGPRSMPVPITPRLTASAVDAQLVSVEAGLGIANVLSYRAAAGMAAGTLVPVLVKHAPLPAPIHLLFDGARGRPFAVRLFIDAMRSQEREGCWS